MFGYDWDDVKLALTSIPAKAIYIGTSIGAGTFCVAKGLEPLIESGLDNDGKRTALATGLGFVVSLVAGNKLNNNKTEKEEEEYIKQIKAEGSLEDRLRLNEERFPYVFEISEDTQKFDFNE